MRWLSYLAKAGAAVMTKSMEVTLLYTRYVSVLRDI